MILVFTEDDTCNNSDVLQAIELNFCIQFCNCYIYILFFQHKIKKWLKVAQNSQKLTHDGPCGSVFGIYRQLLATFLFCVEYIEVRYDQGRPAYKNSAQ